jgi:beta-glucanase (GH16 family)
MENSSARRRRVLAAASALLVAIPLAASATTSANASVPPTPAGWTHVWSDDFTGGAGSLPSSADWIVDTGHSYPGGPANWGTGEVQNYTANPGNLSVDGAGNLRITPLKDAAGNWTSGRIETRRSDFRPPAGGKIAIEGRIQMPNVTGDAALGYWPAFWTLGAPYRGNYWNWPGIGEFDIMENVNGINSVWGVLHCGVAPGGPCNESTGIGNSRACPGVSCQSAFHTYRFEWDESSSPKALRWYVDGQQFHSVTSAQLDATTWNNMTTHSGHFILLNVAMGGAFPNALAGSTPTAATVSGRPMLVDYVSVHTAGGSGGGTPGNGGSAYSPLQAESAAERSGGTVETASEGGQAVGQIGNGGHLKFSGVNFGSGTARQFVGRVASGAGSGVSGLVEVRLDSRTAAPIGGFAVGNTGGWQSWRSVPANISGVTGTHDVYITFTSGQPNPFVSVNWVTFAQ